jgi:redox-sensitive bicupin YhaK (pirin superfamily)
MWCGSSIWHTEASVGTEPARYLQIWITPKAELQNTQPYYEIIEKDPNIYGPILVDLHQDLTIHAGWLKGRTTLNTSNAYLYVVEGSITGSNFTLNEGDGAELDADITADFNAHILLFQEQHNS